MTVKTYCANDEGGRTGLQVLAQLRANQIRDRLEEKGIEPDRIRVELACGPGGTAPPGPDKATLESPRAVLVRN